MSSEATGRNNRLAGETSAYLRQHMDNPVDWYPWGDEAHASARTADKPILVSIGYSACHWCHVMAHESFEDAETAALMNDLFVNIKVDREERPDVDQIFMETVTRLTGHGGWPLTVFCTPDGRPYYGGTYFSPEPRHNLPSFREVLVAVEDAYRNRRDEVDANSRQILDALATTPNGVAEEPPSEHNLTAVVDQLMSAADEQHGGFGDAPKFPTPTNLEVLLAALDFLPPARRVGVLGHCAFTCHEMSRRGLYDHLGGGFHRYCVDGSWTIPHFEKMLYDQGLLLQVYAETWRRTGAFDDDLVWPIRETATYLRRNLTGDRGAAGGFYASEDADSEGEEGRFYVWRPEEVQKHLGDAAPAFCEAYDVTPTGNFEGGTTHLVGRTLDDRARFAEERETLLRVRAERVPPGTDKKRVASWNGYAISGLALAGSLLDDDSMVADAAAAADFVFDEMRDADGRLLRVWAEGRAHIPAFLDDHASMLDACLALQRAGADRFLEGAIRLAWEIAERFFDADEGDFFLTPADGERLVHRPRSDHDGATPNATGLAVLGLLRVSELSGAAELGRVAEQVIATYAYLLERAPHAFPTLLRAVALRARGQQIAVIVGHPDDPAREALAARARRVLRPEDAVVVAAPGTAPTPGLDATWLEGRDPEGGEATAFVCRGQTCSLPITRPDALEDASEA